jgi:hypothetical protein
MEKCLTALPNGRDESRLFEQYIQTLKTKSHQQGPTYVCVQKGSSRKLDHSPRSAKSVISGAEFRQICCANFRRSGAVSAPPLCVCFVYPARTTAARNNERARCSRGSFSQYAQHYLLIFLQTATLTWISSAATRIS